MICNARPAEPAQRTELLRLLAAAGVADHEAVLCFGSYFTDGFDDDSDVDVLVVAEGHTLRKRMLDVDGRTLDLTECAYSTLQELLRKLASRRDWLEILAQAHVVDDRDGRTTQLCAEARTAFATPDPVGAIDVRIAKASVAKHIRKLRRQSDVDYLFFKDSVEILNHLYVLSCHRVRCRPYEYARLRAAHIDAEFPDVAALARLGAGHARRPAEQIAAFCDRAQALLDGLFPQIELRGLMKQLQPQGARDGQSRIA